MELDRDTERTMLEKVVIPKIQEARECLRAGKMEELGKIIAHDLIGLFQPNRDSEREKYDNVPNSLKESPNSERMLKDAELYQDAINLLWDEKADTLRPIDDNTLNAVESIVNDIIHS